MKILAIETSCDETAISIIESKGKTKSPKFTILSNIVSSQVAIHKEFGGVVPNLAEREHQKNLVPILMTALKQAKLFKKKKNAFLKKDAMLHNILSREQELLKRMKDISPLEIPAIDRIAVTAGPGLEPALWVGINFAKALSHLWNIPIVPMNHMEGHIFSALIKQKKISNSKFLISKKSNTPQRYTLHTIRYPIIALLVSGGHTEIVLMKNIGKYTIIGETIDDAAGEAFDKVAKMLGLGYPGGPAISKLANSGDASAIPFPRPMMKKDTYDFSFSGLKTAVLYYLRDHTSYKKRDVAASFQQAVVDVLTAKTMRAMKTHKAKILALGGGVAANMLLRNTLEDAMPRGAKLLLPKISLTGDNALMIAVASYFKKKSTPAKMITARGNLKISD